jgi:hypothetical protein
MGLTAFTQRPTLVAPSQGLCASPAGMVFTWDDFPGALSYTLEIATSPDFSGAAQFVSSTTSFSPPPLPATGQVSGVIHELSTLTHRTTSTVVFSGALR